MASCRPSRPASAVWRERSECAGTRGRAAVGSARKALQHGSVARLWSQRREQRVIAAALEDASVGGAPAAGCLLFVYQHHLGSAPRPPGPTRPHPAPPASVPRGWLGPPNPARWRPPPLPGQPRSAVSWSASERRTPCFPRSVPFSPDWCPRHAVVFQEPSPSNTLLSEFPAGFAFSLRLFGDTSRPPNPFLLVFFVIYMGVFSSKVGPTQQRCLHGRFLFSFFLLLLDLLSLFKTSLIRSVGSSISGDPFYTDTENPIKGKATSCPVSQTPWKGSLVGGFGLPMKCRSPTFPSQTHCSHPTTPPQLESSPRLSLLVFTEALPRLECWSSPSSVDVVLLSQATRGPLRCGILSATGKVGNKGLLGERIVGWMNE